MVAMLNLPDERLDKICPNCLQEWPQCMCTTPIKRSGALADDPSKGFCPDCHQPWWGCKCAGKRLGGARWDHG